MPPGFTILAILLAVLQLVLPKKFAFLPLIIATCHLGNRDLFANFTPCRLIIILGVIRAVASGAFKWSSDNTFDKLFLLFVSIALIVSVKKRLDVPSALIQNMGLILNVFGSYVLGRAYLKEIESVEIFCRSTVFILIPLGIMMCYENYSGNNLYYALGARNPFAAMREGSYRAAGPFSHAILSGTLGTTLFPLMFILWKKEKLKAIIGILACGMIIFSCQSSGPLASAMIGILCMVLWFFRRKISRIHKMVWVMVLTLHFISSRGIWYLMASIDLTGGSTGYHRAKLIDNAFSDFGRWWLAGTDYTREWMWSGVSWSDRHTDITNYYIHLGVLGGVGLSLTFIAIMYLSFLKVGEALKKTNYTASAENLSLWCLGSSLLSQAVGMLSISYFDQMYAILYITIGMVSNEIYRDK